MKNKNFRIVSVLKKADGYSNRMMILEDNKGRRFLLSYWTLIAYTDRAGRLHRLWGDWSVTSIRNHLRKFGFPLGKKEWLSMQVEKLPDGLKIWDLVDYETRHRKLNIAENMGFARGCCTNWGSWF